VKAIYSITLDQMEALVPMSEENLKVAKLSKHLFAGYYNGALMCVMGLIPQTLLSDEAYLWLITMNCVGRHKIVFGIAAHGFIKTILESYYPKLIGHCEARSVKWLRHLGAEIGGMENGLATFRITR
jgi:hypothetical protein